MFFRTDFRISRWPALRFQIPSSITATFFSALVLILALGSPVDAAITCSVSMSNVNFGAPAVLTGSAVNTTGTLSVSCSGAPTGSTTYYCVSLGSGSAGYAGTTRQMTSGSNTLLYNFYQDAARTQPWGGRTSTFFGPMLRVSSSASNYTTFITVYAQLPSGQKAASPGSYSSAFGSGTASFFPLASGGSSCAGTQDSSYPLSFSVLAAPGADCNVTGGTLSFGTAGVLTTDVDATTTIGVACTTGTPFTVGLGNGLTGTSPTARRMTNGSSSILYAIYTDAARSNPWSTTSTVAGTGTGASQAMTVYGRVTPQTTPSPGNYSDTVVITVTY